MAKDRLSILYDWSVAMAAAGDQIKEKHEADYKQIIEFCKTSEDSKERIMCAQTLSRFYKSFPELQESAFDSLVDLCESPDVDVRKHATLQMIAICRGSKHVVSKAADILIQLYQTNEPSESTLINSSLNMLLNLNIEQFFKSFFANFEDGSELVRERSLKFLSSKMANVVDNASKEVEEKLMEYIKKAMADVTKEEFIAFINILSKLKIAKTSTGQATLVSAIKTQAELNKPFDLENTEALNKFLLCAKHTIPFLSQYNRASEYVNYICLNILPVLGKLTSDATDLHVLQILAEMSPFILDEDAPALIDLDKCHETVHSKLLEYLPLPPETPAVTQEVDFQFSHIEYLMYTFVQLSHLKPELYSDSMQNGSRKQLSHLSNGCKKYTDALEKQLTSIKRQDLNKEENKLRSTAIRTTKNISTMILGLFKKPPDFKTSITLSFKPVTVNNNSRGNKRLKIG